MVLPWKFSCCMPAHTTIFLHPFFPCHNVPFSSISSPVSRTVACLEKKFFLQLSVKKLHVYIYLAAKTGVTFNKEFILSLLFKSTSVCQSDILILKSHLFRKYSLWSCTCMYSIKYTLQKIRSISHVHPQALY